MEGTVRPWYPTHTARVVRSVEGIARPWYPHTTRVVRSGDPRPLSGPRSSNHPKPGLPGARGCLVDLFRGKGTNVEGVEGSSSCGSGRPSAHRGNPSVS